MKMAENEKKKKNEKTSNSSKKNNIKKKVNTEKKSTNGEKKDTKIVNTDKKVSAKKVVKSEETNKSVKLNKEEPRIEKAKAEKKANLKKARKQLYYSNNNEGDEFSKLFKIVLIVTAIIVVFYGVTVVVTDKADEARKEAESEKTEIQYDSIMIGSMLNINGSFYVLITDSDDIRLNEYTTMIQTIKANEDAPTIYTADLSNAFNKEYLSDKTNYDSDLEKFRVKGTTLVRVKDHKIEDVYDSYDDIIKKLGELD